MMICTATMGKMTQAELVERLIATRAILDRLFKDGVDWGTPIYKEKRIDEELLEIELGCYNSDGKKVA